MTARKKPAPALAFDLGAFGGRVVYVGGPFNTRTLVLLPTDKAGRLFAGPLAGWAPSDATDAVEHDLAELRGRSESLADGALAAALRTLARDLDNPFTSATARSMAVGRLLDIANRLAELAPPRKEANPADEFTARRIRRLRGGAAT